MKAQRKTCDIRCVVYRRTWSVIFPYETKLKLLHGSCLCLLYFFRLKISVSLARARAGVD